MLSTGYPTELAHEDFEDLQELPFKFQHREAQEPVGVLKLKSWELCVEAISGCVRVAS